MKVELKNIGKKYENRENFTLRGIDLTIEEKDFCVILGPSGCGKTTLLRMIAGLNSVTEGDLLFDGRRVNKVAAKDRDIAMVFQSYALYPHMTVYDNMAFSLSMRKERKKIINERVMEAAELLQITEYLHSKPSDISGGQRQRVALGRAIVRNPSVFLMDEPLSNLDAKLREHMRVELVRLHKKLGTTTIYVTHDQVEAMTMANRIVLMNDGKIQQTGAPDEFYEKPGNIFVAKFIGSPTMNMFDGCITDGNFVFDDGVVRIVPSEPLKKLLDPYEGKNVSVGIRAERFEKDSIHRNNIKCTIDVIEMLGKEKLLYCRLSNDKEIVISAPGYNRYEEGMEYTFGFDDSVVHYFNTETGERINK
ncbi:MAG: sn-glycerol-3-phosphate ABC transporter ATP-binding protein UgpC [Clostridia bacterium]|nr:sn-glycerol-3-phosphate ABC transporter ATP-binding protein UgpC [Clostridia bacterium]